MNDHINLKQIFFFSFEEVEGMKFCHLCTNLPKMLSVVKQGWTTFSLSGLFTQPKGAFPACIQENKHNENGRAAKGCPW